MLFYINDGAKKVAVFGPKIVDFLLAGLRPAPRWASRPRPQLGLPPQTPFTSGELNWRRAETARFRFPIQVMYLTLEPLRGPPPAPGPGALTIGGRDRDVYTFAHTKHSAAVWCGAACSGLCGGAVEGFHSQYINHFNRKELHTLDTHGTMRPTHGHTDRYPGQYGVKSLRHALLVRRGVAASLRAVGVRPYPDGAVVAA